MREHARRRLSEELHARPYHDFEGAGRFIRFIFLFEENDADIIAHINAVGAEEPPALTANTKFTRVLINDFAMRVEQHTEFVSLSFIEKGCSETGLAKHALICLACHTCHLTGCGKCQLNYFMLSGLKLEANHRAVCQMMILDNYLIAGLHRPI